MSVEDAMIVKELSPALRADADFFLRRSVVFRDVPNSALGSLVDILKRNSAKKGETVVAQGVAGTAMYVIIEGAAQFSAGHLWLPLLAKISHRLKHVQQLIISEIMDS